MAGLLRKRFTAIHELGHLLLNMPIASDEKFKEKACHRFAGAILLPRKIMLMEFGARRAKLSLKELFHISNYYGVSPSAIVYRGVELGVFTNSLASRFWKMRRNNELHQQSLGKY